MMTPKKGERRKYRISAVEDRVGRVSGTIIGDSESTTTKR